MNDRLSVLPLLYFLCLGFVLPAILVATAVDRPSVLGPVLAWSIVLYSSARLSRLASIGEQRLLGMTFWVFVYVMLGIAPLTQFTNDAFPFPGLYSQRTIVLSFLVVVSGLVAYDVGNASLSRRIRADGALARVLVRRQSSVNRSIALGIGAVVVCIALILLLGGVSSVVVSRFDFFAHVREFAGGEGHARVQAVLRVLQTTPFVTFYCLWLHWLRKRRHSHISLLVLAVLGALALVNLLVNSPLNSPRYWFGTILLSLALASLRWRRHSFALWSAAIIVAFLLVFPRAALFRNTLDVDFIEYRGPRLLEADFDAFQQLMNSTVYVEENGLSYGRQTLGTLLFWVPRTLWLDKPRPSGEEVASNYGYSYTNMSLPLWGEAYLDGSLLLVVGVFLLYGAVTAFLDKQFMARPQDDVSFVRFLVPVLAPYQIFFLRGPLMSALAYLVPVIVMLLMLTRSAPDSAPQPTRARAAPLASPPV